MTRFLIFTLTVLLLTGLGCGPPEPVIAPPAESPPSPPPPTTATGVIKDLAYIKTFVSAYSDDADPEYEGLTVDISYCDSTSDYISFRNIPIVVTIKLYGYRDFLDAFDHERMELVCQTQVRVDHSGYGWEDYIRIPFENITVDRDKYYSLGTMKVTVTTPKQGDFEAIEDLVWLYPE